MSHETEILAPQTIASSLPLPEPRVPVVVRAATMGDLPFMDSLQKLHTKQLGWMPTKQLEGYIAMGGVLIAETGGAAIGYIISRDRYLKRDELGVVYQLCVAPGAQRKLVGAALVREVFARSAYGCRLYCCWCAQDLEANCFWESMGFVPIAFRAGSSGKKRVHIFWQKRIVEGDDQTKWWYPSQTNQGAIREDRLVFPILPGVHWKDVEAVAVARENPKLETGNPNRIRSPKSRMLKGPLPPTTRRVQFGPPGARPIPEAIAQTRVEKSPAPRPKKAAPTIDPKLRVAARELRDRWLERVNATPLLSQGKYDVSRALNAPSSKMQVNPILPKQLPEAA